MHNLVQDMQLFFWFCILTNLDIIMGCLCWKTLPKLQNLMSMGRNSNQRTRIKLDKVAIDKQKRLGWKIIQVWTKPQNPRRPIRCEKYQEDVFSIVINSVPFRPERTEFFVPAWRPVPETPPFHLGPDFGVFWPVSAVPANSGQYGILS